MMPSQKTGTEMKSDGSACRPARSQPIPVMFEAAARRIVRISAAVKPSDASSRVDGRLVSSSLLTGTPAWIE